MITQAKTRRTWLLVVEAVAVAAAVIFALLALVPVSHTYSFSLAPCLGGGAVRQFPNGASVVVHWYESDGSQVIFYFRQGGDVYQETNSSGSYSFTASGQNVYFQVSPTGFSCPQSNVEVYGHWSAPTLIL